MILRAITKTILKPAGIDTLKSPSSSWLAVLLFALFPSFIQRRLRPDQFKPRRLHSTSWLDGLRGVAALFVYVNHYTARNFARFERMYGDHDEKHTWSSPLQLPFVRVIYCGFPMVHIFFVISGVALSYKPIKLARARQHAELLESLSSSTFRRMFRLYLPPMASSLFVMMAAYLGIEGKRFPTLAEHLRDWFGCFWDITSIWRWDGLWFPGYDVHLWTISIEFSHSMVLFLLVIATCRMKTHLRFAALLAFMAYALRCGHWGPAEFTAGILITEITLIQAERRAAVESSPTTRSTNDMSRVRLAWVLFWSANVVVALFLAGWPRGSDATKITGYAFLHRHTMEPFFGQGGDMLVFPWYALGAVQIVLAVNQLPSLQRLFTSKLAQYLGDISFSLYLMHGPTQVILEHRVLPYMWTLVKAKEDPCMWQFTVAWACGLLVLMPITIWCSEVFWRLMDVRSVAFARWLEQQCLTKEPVNAWYVSVPDPGSEMTTIPR